MQVERLTICFICEFTSFIYNSLAKKHDIIIIIEFRGFVKPPASISVRCYLIEISSAEMKSAPSISPLSNQHCFRGGGGLHFKWCQGEAAGVGNRYNCVGVPTTFGRHCLNLIFKEDR